MGIKKVFSSIFKGLNPVNTVANGLDMLFTSEEERLHLKLEETKAMIDLEIEQIRSIKQSSTDQSKINLEEAKSTNWFVAGWRPALGWTFAVIFLYKFLIYPLLSHYLPISDLDVQDILPVLLGMLGLGGMRSFEKYKKISNMH